MMECSQKHIAAIILSLVVCCTLTGALDNVCAGIKSGFVEHPTNCTLYYKCINERTILSLCYKNCWFSLNLGKCINKQLFSDTDAKKCQQTAINKKSYIRIKRCIIDPQIEVQWKHENDANNKKEKSLPKQILLNLPVGEQMTMLNLNIKPNMTNNLTVLLNTRGWVKTWKASNNETWSVYSDLKSESSVSVATHDVNGTSNVVYDGTFVLNSTKYFIRRDTGRRSVPLDPSKTRQISINGTTYILTEENSTTGQYDYFRGAQSTSINTSSVMTDLEKLVNAQYQSSSTKRRFGLELFIVLDYSIFYKWLIQSSGNTVDAIYNIRYFYTHIVNGINDRYASIQESDMSFYVKLVGYYIAQTPSDSLFTEKPGIKLSSYATEAYYALDEFKAWLATESKKVPSTLPRFDSAALFTDYTILAYNTFLNDTYQINGLAYKRATCTLFGVSINKDFGQYATIETASHEIGHNLGAEHDGENDLCNSQDQYIMSLAPGALTNQTFNNSFTFSSCSINYFRSYIAQLDQGNNNCLLNEAYDVDPTSTTIFLQTYPGQNYSVAKQCQLLYGQNSYYCAGGGERDKSICRELVCYDPSKGTCVSKVEQRALDGTTCASKSWCLRGTCTYDDRAPVASASCLYGDYKINFNVQIGNINCDYMALYMKWMCYDQYYSDLCCSSCARIKNNNYPGCEYGDRSGTACSSLTSQQCYDSYTQSLCCSSCLRKEVNLPVSNCRYGDKASWCAGLSSTSCYTSNDTCCQECLKYKISIQGCEYGDKMGGCTIDHCSYSYYWTSCCKTCQQYINLITIRLISTTTITSTTTTTTTSRPSSGACPQGDLASWCSTITPDVCYSSKDMCCAKCQTFYNPSNPGCEYGDQASWCSTYVQSSTECQRSEVASLCCASCRKYLTPNSVVPSCPYGDQASYCSNVQTWDCYNYKSTCCTSCAKYYNSTFTNCEYGDKVSWCSTYVQGITECQRPEVADLCCKTCANVKKTLTDPVCKDNADWCAGLFPGFCYDTNTENTCCATCKNYLNGKTGACRYGNLYTWCLPIYCAMNSKECCAIC